MPIYSLKKKNANLYTHDSCFFFEEAHTILLTLNIKKKAWILKNPLCTSLKHNKFKIKKHKFFYFFIFNFEALKKRLNY